MVIEGFYRWQAKNVHDIYKIEMYRTHKEKVCKGKRKKFDTQCIYLSIYLSNFLYLVVVIFLAPAAYAVGTTRIEIEGERQAFLAIFLFFSFLSFIYLQQLPRKQQQQQAAQPAHDNNTKELLMASWLYYLLQTFFSLDRILQVVIASRIVLVEYIFCKSVENESPRND